MIESGHNSCWGTNVSGHKHVWAQSILGTNVCGYSHVVTIMFGHKSGGTDKNIMFLLCVYQGLLTVTQDVQIRFLVQLAPS